MGLKNVIIALAISILITYFGLSAVHNYAFREEDRRLQSQLERQEEEAFSIEVFNDTEYTRPPRFCVFNCVPAPDHRQCQEKCSSWGDQEDHLIVGSSASNVGECYCFYHGV